MNLNLNWICAVVVVVSTFHGVSAKKVRGVPPKPDGDDNLEPMSNPPDLSMSCTVDNWSSWSGCQPAKCTPCQYFQGKPGFLARASVSADFPTQMTEKEMKKARGPSMTKMMKNKANSIQAIGKKYQEEGTPVLTSLNQTCTNNYAGNFPCSDVDLNWWKGAAEKDWLKETNDNWGWRSPYTGTEYALVGTKVGTAFMKVEDGEIIGFLPTQTRSSTWRDIKVYDHYALIVSEASNHGLQIFDLRELDSATSVSTFSATHHYGMFGSAHNVVVNEETARAYAVGSNTCEGGLHAIDIENPLNPVYIGCAWGTDYVHDAQCVIYRGKDAAYFGKEICFLYSEQEIRIVDMTPMPGTEISMLVYNGVKYSHQGWLNCEMDLLFVDDELDEFDHSGPGTTRTYIVDVASLQNPKVVKVHDAKIDAIDHNQYVCGAFVYQANYAAGLRILDASNARTANFKEVAYFDVNPSRDALAFEGAWNAFPFFNSGKVVVNSSKNGVGIVSPNLFSQKRTRKMISVVGDYVCPLLEQERSCDRATPFTSPPTKSPVASPPSQNPIASPTNNLGDCRKWCNHHPSDWSKKCNWNRTCAGCPSCSSTPSAGPPTKSPATSLRCKKFCEDYPKEWWKKCTWNKCAACSQCAQYF